MARIPLSALPTLAVVALLAAGRAIAADGNLDPSFWGDGRYSALAAPDELFLGEALEAPDGALVWVGARRPQGQAQYFARWRRLTDSIESGCELALPAGVRGTFSAGAFDASGRLVAGGWAWLADDSYRLLVARYFYPSCVLDPDFDVDGVLEIDVGAPALAWIAGLATDGDAILFAGNVQFAGASNIDGIVGRLLPGGGFDTSFSSDGWVALDGRAGNDLVLGLRRAPGGRIYVGGYGHLPDGTHTDFYLFGLQANGAPIPGFGLNGLVSVDFGSSAANPADFLTGLTLLHDGRILLAGWASLDVAPGYGGGLAMVLPSGALDASFGTGGRLVDPGRNEFRAVMAQGNGRFLLAAADSPYDTYYVARRLDDGSPDPTFAGGAWVPFSFPEGGFHAVQSLALQAGRPVLGGFLELSGEPDVAAVARLTSTYIFADGFEIGSSWFWSAAAP